MQRGLKYGVQFGHMPVVRELFGRFCCKFEPLTGCLNACDECLADMDLGVDSTERGSAPLTNVEHTKVTLGGPRPLCHA